ncbi:MAG: 3-isopropylmalate dehydratase large subunit [Chloroflexi bacterium]|nr:3-isopropylmalate dehydratase large subunit [Chloroflexota bacterium]
MGMTITEKIFARAYGRNKVAAGDFLWAKVDTLIFHELLTPYSIGKQFKSLGPVKVWDPDRVVITIDHTVPGSTGPWPEVHQKLRQFVREQGIKNFYDIGRHGISCQIAAENGHVLPGTLCIADDAVVTALGALGVVATKVASEVFVILALGEHWFRVPESIKIEISGEFQKGVGARDLVQRLLADLGPGAAPYKAIELVGSTIEAMSISQRMVLCNLLEYTGAKNVIINPDEKTAEYIHKITGKAIEMVRSDPDAGYEKIFHYDVSNLEPLLAVPPSVHSGLPVSSIDKKVDQAFVGSCVGGRLEDLRIAAQIVKGRKVSPHTRFYVTPATQAIYRQAEEEGVLQALVDSGAAVMTPGCTVCLGNVGALAPGEVCIASSTANYAGRMGSDQAEIYLASPAIVAASAVEGKIADPRNYL